MSSPTPEGPVVVNSGPLIALSHLGRLDVLEGLFGQVLVPEAVWHEVVESGKGRPGAAEVSTAAFLERTPVARPPDALLAAELGAGEAAAITLAHDLSARVVLLDDRKARRVAEQAYGLPVRGTARLLVDAKHLGLVDAVRPLLDTLVAADYRLSQRIIDAAAESAGE